MKFTIRDTFNTDAETFWRQIFFDPEFNEQLYRDGLNFKGLEVLELTGQPGEKRTRTMRTEPGGEPPAVVKKLIGDSLTYTESGTYDPQTGIWSFSIRTNKLSDKVSIAGRLWVESKGDKQCERVAEIEVGVKIFGVGGVVEKFIEQTTRRSYERATDFTNRWIADKGL